MGGSEVEVDKLIGVPFSEFDQISASRPKRRRDQPFAAARQPREMSWLAGNRKASRGRRTIGTRLTAVQIRRNRKALKNMPGGIQRAGAEDHAGQQHERHRQRPAEQ